MNRRWTTTSAPARAGMQMPQLHLSMAKALQGMGRDHEALDQCRLALAMAPRDWSAQFSCAKIREAVASSGS